MNVAELQNKLNNFSSSVYKKASEECQRILEEAEAIRKTRLKEEETKMIDDYNKKIKDEITVQYNSNNAMLLKANMQARRKLVNARDAISDATFEDVKQELYNFMQTPEYKEYLVKSINSFDSKGIIYFNKSDEHFISEFQEIFPDLEFQVYNSDIMGGVIFFDGKNMMINQSFKAKLEDAKKNFLNISKLSIEQ